MERAGRAGRGIRISGQAKNLQADCSRIHACMHAGGRKHVDTVYKTKSVKLLPKLLSKRRRRY